MLKNILLKKEMLFLLLEITFLTKYNVKSRFKKNYLCLFKTFFIVWLFSGGTNTKNNSTNDECWETVNLKILLNVGEDFYPQSRLYSCMSRVHMEQLASWK